MTAEFPDTSLAELEARRALAEEEAEERLLASLRAELARREES